MQNISCLIHLWFEANKRDLPWRHTKDPYQIWLSEIILQQTQVVQGLSYYLKFIKEFPSIRDLAGASEDRVLKLWQGLGYYSRARNLHQTAKVITDLYAGIFPQDYASIRQLKGIGDYTAAAIASFAFDLPYAVVDGNVFRVLARLFDVNTPIDTTEGKKVFLKLANELLDKNKPALHNQAIMEFGALYCKPNNPDCLNCILKYQCLAFKHNKVNQLPVKSKKIRTTKRYFNYLVINTDKYVLIEQRRTKDIWRNLYQFPLIENMSPVEISNEEAIKKVFGNLIQFDVEFVSKTYKHILTHQTIEAKFTVFRLANVYSTLSSDYFWQDKIDLEQIGVPRLIDKFLKDYPLG